MNHISLGSPKQWLAHLVAIFCVVTLPPVLYDHISKSHLSHVRGLDMAGALTYTIYTLYWVNKLKSERARFILANLIALLTLSFFVVVAAHSRTSAWVCAVPLAFASGSLATAASAAIGRSWQLLVTSLWSALINMPIGALASAMAVVAGFPVSIGF